MIQWVNFLNCDIQLDSAKLMLNLAVNVSVSRLWV